MDGVDLTGFGGKPERLGADAKKSSRLGKVEPRLNAVGSRTVDRDPVIGSECCHTLARPTIVVASDQFVSVQNAGDEVVADDKRELPNRSDDIGRGAVALASAPSRQAQLGMNAAHPVDQENDLGSLGVDIGD